MNSCCRRFTAAVGAAVFFSSGCALTLGGSMQRVRVNTTPPGAQVLVNGELAGMTPTEVVLRRRDADAALCVRRDGFGSEWIMPQRGFSRWLWVDVVLSALLTGAGLVSGQGETESIGPGRVLARSALGPAVILVPSFITGAAYAFQGSVDATLTPLAELVDTATADFGRPVPMVVDVGANPQSSLVGGSALTTRDGGSGWAQCARARIDQLATAESDGNRARVGNTNLMDQPGEWGADGARLRRRVRAMRLGMDDPRFRVVEREPEGRP